MKASKDGARSSERGAMVLFLALMLVGLIGIGALAVDLGIALVTRSELQNVSDAATLAANRELALLYSELPSTTDNRKYQLKTADKSRIADKATTFAGLNQAAGVSISLLPEDLTYGTYDLATGTITPTTTGVRAIQIKSRRDESANGVLPTFLARVLGIQSMNISATAAAGVSPLGGLPAGGGDIPIAISSHWFESNACGPNSTIRFYPTGDLAGCAGWHTFNDTPASAARLGKILEGLEEGTYETPLTMAGDTYFNFIGGSVASRFSDMQSLYDAKKDVNGNWDVNIPVYQDDTCANPNQAKLIIGFAKARIFKVKDAPFKTIEANVECGVIENGISNGPNDYGTLSSVPVMIQ